MGDQVESIHGQNYVFGFPAADQASITISNFTPRGISTSDREPEVFQTATNGEGFVEAVAIAKPANKMISVTLIGYISSAFNAGTVGNSFTLFGRFFLIKKISDPRQKGQFVEVSIDAVSYPLVTS